jgi:hypothetical protein
MDDTFGNMMHFAHVVKFDKHCLRFNRTHAYCKATFYVGNVMVEAVRKILKGKRHHAPQFFSSMYVIIKLACFLKTI